MEADVFLRVILPAFNIAIAIYVYWSTRSAAKDKELQELKQKVTTLEERVRNMPDHQLITTMTSDVKAVRAELQGLRDVISPLARSVERINDYLLSNKT